MEPDKNATPEVQPPQEGAALGAEPQAPVDALSRTPDDLETEQAATAAASVDPNAANDPNVKKVSAFKRIFRKVNLYFLIFILLMIVVGAIAIVNYLNSQKAPVEPNVASQQLTADTLKQLANSDASVGNSSQTLTIQGNAVIAGQTLIRSNLNVAGTIQSGGSVTAPTITISGAANLGATQANSLQVAQNVAVQGTTTLRDLNVSGTTSLSGAVTASQITVTRLILSGNATLQIPNHISFTGASPSRTVNNAVLGNGGSASINGSDTAGTVNINTGTATTAGCFVRVTFQQGYSNQPHVTVSPIGAAAGQLQWYVDRNTTGFSICTNNSAPINQVFAFDYFVTN